MTAVVDETVIEQLEQNLDRPDITGYRLPHEPVRPRRNGPINFEELRYQIAWARADWDARQRGRHGHPEIRWDQNYWIVVPVANRNDFCQTAACLAGHTVLSNGAEISEQLDHDDGGFSSVEYRKKIWQISVLAQRMLGLTTSQADVLFEASNTINELEEILFEWECGNLDFDPRGDVCQCGVRNCQELAL